MTNAVPMSRRSPGTLVALVLVRRHAWWHNKVPLSILLFMLLIDGARASTTAVLSLLALVVIVCAVANVGYAINELFDRDEDARASRHNAAASGGLWIMWTAVASSAAIACGLAALTGGVYALAITAAELLLPMAYSIPPLRLKERGWLGVMADATAAHAYPAALALLIVAHLQLAPLTMLQGIAVLVWGVTAGMRGILSHQLHTSARDEAAGLRTVVHRIGHARVRRIVMRVVLPVEIIAFVSAVACAPASAWLVVAACVPVACEWMKWRTNVMPTVAFDPAGEHYLPYVDDAIYKVWAPLILIVDAGLRDARWLLLLPLFIVLFRPRLRVEWRVLRAAVAA